MLFSKKNRNEEDNAVLRQMLNASSVGFAFIAGVVVGGIMGYYLDKWLGTSPYLLIVFLFFGVIAGIKNAIYYIRNAGIILTPLIDKENYDKLNNNAVIQNIEEKEEEFVKNNNEETADKNKEKTEVKKDNPWDRLSNN